MYTKCSNGFSPLWKHGALEQGTIDAINNYKYGPEKVNFVMSKLVQTFVVSFLKPIDSLT